MDGLLDIAQAAFAFILVLSILVFIHEWGHYITARLCGVRVVVFSIGFGPEIFGWNDKHGTRWKISYVPLGGYVKFFGDMTAASTPDTKAGQEMTESEKSVAFQFKKLWQKSAIVFAGPLANFILALAILAGLFFLNGQNYTPAIVGSFSENSAAQKAGMEIDDHIIQVDGRDVERYDDLIGAISMNVGDEIEFVVDRGGQLLTINIVPNKVPTTDRFGNEITRPLIGILGKKGTFKIKEHGVFSAVGAATVEIQEIINRSLRGISQMITGKRSVKEMSGPIGIGKYAGQFFEHGIASLIFFAAMVSINLGLINLFPIPLLDGGHLFFYAYEAIFRRPMSEKAQEYGFRVGLLLLSGLMIFATVNDLTK